VRTIILDPGHGGTETGAVGPKGTQEKDLTLELAQLVRAKLEARVAARVVLTRTDDRTLPLSDRSALANQYKADLFVAIHLNSSRGSTAFGAETYFLSLQASDERAAAAAAAENQSAPEAAPSAAPRDEAAAELELLLWDLAQTRHLARSQRLANLIQEELNSALGLRDRGVKQAPFRVLMGAAMPAVLVEFGFISNPDEEAKLADPAHRAQLADALVAAISRFKAELEGVRSSPAEAIEPTTPTTPTTVPSPTPPATGARP
jgi:N-acetylmuramoyl-L-alanine amidase